MIVSKTAHVILMVRDLTWSLVFLVGWDILIVFCEKVMHWQWVGWPSVPLALYGTAIGIIVGSGMAQHMRAGGRHGRCGAQS